MVYVDLVPPVLSITNENNVGNGRCANMPLITLGRKVIYKSSWESVLSELHDSGNHALLGSAPYIYAEVSDTKSVMEMTTLNPETSKTIEDDYVIANNFMELSKKEIKVKGIAMSATSSGSESVTIFGNAIIEKSYKPTKRFPAKVFCENQTWNSSYTEIVKTTSRKVSCVTRLEHSTIEQPCAANNTFFEETENETFSEYQVDVLAEGNVEAINELKTITAGTLNTVKIRRRSSNFYDEPNSVIWLSTEYGVMVYKEDYNKLGILEKTTELVSLE